MRWRRRGVRSVLWPACVQTCLHRPTPVLSKQRSLSDYSTRGGAGGRLRTTEDSRPLVHLFSVLVCPVSTVCRAAGSAMCKMYRTRRVPPLHQPYLFEYLHFSYRYTVYTHMQQMRACDSFRYAVRTRSDIRLALPLLLQTVYCERNSA